jgi:hypothetical protein
VNDLLPFGNQDDPILDFGFWILDWVGRGARKIQNPKSKIKIDRSGAV